MKTVIITGSARGFGYAMTEEFLKKGTEVNLPYVVKPVSEGSSVGVFIVEKIDDISKISYEKNFNLFDHSPLLPMWQ